MNTSIEHESIREKVRTGYSQIAETGSMRRQSGGCCGTSSDCVTPAQLAATIGYSPDELATLPEGANMGLSCGNPNALAALQSGEVVLDLGSGGGFDVFIAGRKVGATGRVIGVDMTPDMLAKARRNIVTYREQTGLDNVEFRLGEIEHLPLADASVDVVISNCVINLSPDKPQVWREIARVLRPGGRVAVSDLALLRQLPESVRGMLEALVGCVAGASLVADLEPMIVEAGLSGVLLTSRATYVESLSAGGDPLFKKILDQLPEGMMPADFVTSLEVVAHKPDSQCCCDAC